MCIRDRKESLSYLVIKQIQAVYREEDKLKELKPEDRLKQRQVVIKPLVDALFAYLKSNERKASTAKLKQAVTYALNQEKYLRVFLEDGEVPMDNNASERAITVSYTHLDVYKRQIVDRYLKCLLLIMIGKIYVRKII